jgi:glc operon protein GlcG
MGGRRGRFTSQRLYDVVKDDDALRTGLAHAPRMTLLGGGVPIVVGGAVVGAIGVGGGTIDQDIVVAEAGLAALG